MAQGFNPTMADGHPSGGGSEVPKAQDTDGGKIHKKALTGEQLGRSAFTVLSVHLMNVQTPS